MTPIDNSHSRRLVIGLGLLWGGTSVHSGDVDDLLGMLPADSATVVIVFHPATFDHRLDMIIKTLGIVLPDQGSRAVMAGVPLVGSWFDTSRPFAMTSSGVGMGAPAITWGRIEDFEARMRATPGTKSENGVWTVDTNLLKGVPAAPVPYMKSAGAYVVAAPTRQLLEEVSTLAERVRREEVGARFRQVRSFDLFLRLRVESFRSKVLAAIQQAEAMAPGLALVLAQQGGSDPASTGKALGRVLAAARELVGQAEFIELFLDLKDSEVKVTLFFGFGEGAIRRYLAAQAPSRHLFFAELPNQPFAIALGAHLPTGASAPMDWMLDGQAADGDASSAVAMRVIKRLLQLVDGEELTIRDVGAGLEIAGRYLGKDSAGIQRLVREYFELQGAGLASTGIAFERMSPPSEATRGMDQFRLCFDDRHPQGMAMKTLLGVDPVVSIRGIPSGVSFRLAPIGLPEQRYPQTPSESLAARKDTVEAMSRLSSVPNVVLLVDPNGLRNFFGSADTPAQNLTKSTGGLLVVSATLLDTTVRIELATPVGVLKSVIAGLQPPSSVPGSTEKGQSQR